MFIWTTMLLAQSTLVTVPVLLGAFASVWYALPLVVAVSIVYGATRHENPKEIVHHTIRSFVGVCTFMFVIFAVIFLAGFWN